VRSAILSGDVSGGERLRQNHVAEALNVSRTPVREAFQRLEGEAFLQMTPWREVIVSSLSVGEAEELFATRAALEPLALERAFSSLTKRDLGEAGDILDANQVEQDPLRLAGLNWEFTRRCSNQLCSRC